MASYTIDKFKYNNNIYNLQDAGALQLTSESGQTVSGPVSFEDSVSIDDATAGNLVVTGSASFTNNIAANTISGNLTGNVTGNVSWSGVTGKPTSTGSASTGITATTTATKTTLGTASSVTGVQSTTTTASKASGGNGTAPSWVFEEISIPNVTAAGSASTWAFEDIACDDITSWSAGSGSASISGAVNASDSSQLDITISHSHVAPSLSYTARTVSSKKSGANSTAPTIGTAIKVQSKKSGSNGSASTWSFTDVTVPIKNTSATSIPNVSVASATVSITDSGHSHTV